MANGSIGKFTGKIFPATAPGDQSANNNPKTPLFSPSADKSGTNTALNHITGQIAARQSSASQTAAAKGADDGDTRKTVVDFYKEVLERQPFEAESLAKKEVSVVLDTKKPAAQMTLADYEMAKDRAIFKQAGYSMLTDEEIRMAVSAVRSHGAVNHGGGLDELRRVDNQPGWMFIKTDQATIEYAKRAGQAVLQYQEYKAKRLDAAIEKGQKYATDALGGFVQPIVNAPINILNGISEPFRAGERTLFGTSNIPEIPRMTVAERSEYWNKDGRQIINRGAEIGATITLGGAAGGKAIGTQAGRIFLGTESAYNIGAGVVGKDVTQTDAQGNARQMPIWERGFRITGGVFGARKTINTEIAIPNSITNRTVDKLDDIFKNNSSIKPQGEFVTPDGLRVKVPTGKTPIEKLNEPLEISISSDKANAPHIEKGSRPPYSGLRAQEIVLRQETVFVRVHNKNLLGSWLMRKKDIQGLTARQIKDKFALPDLPSKISEIYVPAGTRVRVGIAAPQKGWGIGGGTQYELIDKIPATSFKNTRELK